METVLGVIKASEETKSPVVLQIAEVRLKNSPLEIIGPLMVAAAENASVPVAVHFDHGKTLDKIELALKTGFKSAMFDGSSLPFGENVEATLAAKALARKYGADCEAEIGRVGGGEDGSKVEADYTDPDAALEFYERTGADALAVSIGNAHGNYKSAPRLRFDVLGRISELVFAPLVLHGGTGISSEDFKRCIKLGIRKINIATATFDSVVKNAENAFLNGKIAGYYDLQEAEVEGAYLNALKHIEIFGSAGKA